MYDVIILDLHMPITDGYEACKKIRALYDASKLMKKSFLIKNVKKTNKRNNMSK
jgi:CheY-like chemotaxis protein